MEALSFSDWAALAVALIGAGLFGGLIAFGRDGMMATYGAMVIAAALALLWAGWRPGSR